MSKPYKLKIETEEIKYEIEDSFKDGGNTIEIKIVLPYSSLQTIHTIKHCNECPVGYMQHNCGRRIPLDYDCVPESCKLKRLSMGDLLRFLAKSVDVAEIMQ